MQISLNIISVELVENITEGQDNFNISSVQNVQQSAEKRVMWQTKRSGEPMRPIRSKDSAGHTSIQKGGKPVNRFIRYAKRN